MNRIDIEDLAYDIVLDHIESGPEFDAIVDAVDGERGDATQADYEAVQREVMRLLTDIANRV